MRRSLFAIVVLMLALAQGRAQLVITEVLSLASTNLGGTVVPQNSDFWELTNFGTNSVDLTGYKWNDDSGGLAGADAAPFNGLILGPGASVIFVESTASGSTTEQQFREWWGAGLPASTQIRFYTGNGFGNGGDGVRLWSPTATNDAATVARVDFGGATRGVSFTYSPTTGTFGVLSTNGVNGAYKAATADDVGSPGVTTGPVVVAPPTVQTPPASLVVYVGQNARFTVTASGSPTPAYQWRYNGTPISGATSNSYTVVNAQTNNAGVYSVVISNPHGAVTNQATLTVTERPRLVITEVSSAQATNPPTAGHNDWWELTNLGDSPVDLFRYRFDDASASRNAAFVIEDHIIIAPGESIIFLDGSSAANFRQWWGESNLSTNLQIISYNVSGIGLSATSDALYLWNPGATNDNDYIASATFGSATPGVTFGFDPETEVFGSLSVAGQDGAFVATQSGDIGSPGVIRAPGEFRILSLTRSAGQVQLTWAGTPNETYVVQSRNNLGASTWANYTNITATGAVTTVTLPDNGTAPERYFRLCTQP
jgi:hypothetical protein